MGLYRKRLWVLSFAAVFIWIVATLVEARTRSGNNNDQKQQHRHYHHRHQLNTPHNKLQNYEKHVKVKAKHQQHEPPAKHHHHHQERKKDKGNKQERKDKKHNTDKKKGHDKTKEKGSKRSGKKGSRPHKPKVGGMEHSFGISDISCGPGLDVMTCPKERPCCSRWGFCGDDTAYCDAGCQPAFGKCDRASKDAVVEVGNGNGKHKHHRKPTRKSHHGFDLRDRQNSLPGQDGKKFRIPSSVPKLPPSGTLVNIAYFPGWTQYRGQGGGSRNSCHQRPYLPSAIPWSSLDYVIFAFVYFDDDYQLYPADLSDEALYFQANQLKMATNTRVMISIGGWSFTHPESKKDEDTRHRFENMIASQDSRRSFIESCIEFCQFYGFDGVDIDYEYPALKDRDLVTALFQEMRIAFDKERSGLVLSLAGASFSDGIQGFDFEKVAAATDFVMIMAYGECINS